MSYFRPIRSSPPPRSTLSATTLVPNSAVSDVSRSSIVSAPELASLSPDDVEFIDAVISRASPSETAFLNVFKAYNAVLQERGLDPGNEVEYYGKLLKLGTLKGANWGEKWRAVKAQNGYAGPSRKPGLPAVTTSKASAARLLQRLRTLNHGKLESAESAADDVLSQTEATEEDTELDFPQDRRPPFRTASPSTTTNSLGLDIDAAPSYPTPKSTSRPVAARQPARYAAKDPEVSRSAPSPYNVPSTRASAPRNTNATPRPIPIRVHRPSTTRPSSTSPPKSTITRPPEHKGGVINEDDAWSKIRMAQDEQEADRFRQERLLDRCLDVWKQGYEWIITTSAQIDQARHILVLRVTFQKWRSRLTSRRALDTRVSAFAANVRTKAAFAAWRARLQEKRQADWRRDMRAKMKAVREAREAALRKDAWAKWRQLHQSHLARQHYAQRLVLRFVSRWREKLGRLDGLEDAADRLVVKREKQVVVASWDMWRRAADLRGMEAALAARITARTVREVLEVWRRQMEDLHAADAAHNTLVLKFALRRWRSAQTRIRTLERRADKHLARQDDILVRAVSRVWRAHELGRLLERVRTVRLLRQSMEVWKQRKQGQEQLEAKALKFALRSSSHVVTSALGLWRRRKADQEQAIALAAEYDKAQLQYRMLRAWRLLLRVKKEMARQAKAQVKVHTKTVYMKRWMAKLEERRRDKKLQELRQQKLMRIYHTWKQGALRQRRLRLTEQEVQTRQANRIIRESLTLWTNRVIDLKLREIEVARRSDRTALLAVFDKWKALCIRHAEELSLMESHRHIKRDELLRRTFHKWLVAARTARHRRVILLEKEDEMRRFQLAAAWDKWRGQFEAERLLPLERTFALQNQNAILYRAFAVWHSKTKSLPAVHFQASRTKTRFWKIWREAMPNALQGKKAREVDKKSVLTRAFGKWLQAHRTKIALRAVARARYMRLPTTASSSRPISTLLSRPAPQASGSRLAPARRSARPPPPETDTELDTEAERPVPLAQPRPRAPASRIGITSLLSSRPPTRLVRDPSPTRPRFSTRSTGTRDPSPTRSRASRDTSPARSAVSRPPSTAVASRGSLWLELKEIQRKSRTPTVRSSRSPEPP